MKSYSILYPATILTTLRATVSAVVLLFTALVAHAQTNLVADGSFESTPIGESQFTSAWSLVAGASENSDYGVATATGGYDVAEQGTNYAYFRGHPTDDSQDCLGQYVTLTVGALYHISYWEGTDGPLTNGAAMYAQIGADYGLSSSDTPLPPFFPHSAAALPYQEFSTNWIANSDYPILSFHGVNATNGLAVTNSILLDNVSMVLAYPPLTPAYSAPNSLVFTWPYANSPYRLQSCTNLVTANWATLSNAPVNVGSSNQITLTIPTNSAMFYRLTLP